jgi:hypothetical protein
MKFSALSVPRSWEMQHLIHLFSTAGTVALVSLVGITSLALTTKSAFAQAAYGSYVGAGVSGGTMEGSQGNGRQVGGVIAVRYKLLEIPISFRTQALIGSGTAVVPTISYDVPLNWQTDAYLGAGAAFARDRKSVV